MVYDQARGHCQQPKSQFVIRFTLSLTHRILVSDEDDAEAKARRVVRTNNFTKQTNVLDVDKHM